LRGQASKVGDTRVSANQYHYTKTEEGWRLTHHLIAEKNLGRKLKSDERVSFKDKNRKNLNADNIIVSTVGSGTKDRARARILVRMQELAAELKALDS
jgi:HNH endonuclease